MFETKEQIEAKIAELEQEAETLNIVQFALKTLLNSYYGALANQYCSYFDLRLATSITKGGQVSVRGTAAYVESKTNGKIPNNYTDTDSNFFLMDKCIPDEIRVKSKKEIVDWLIEYQKENLEPIISEYLSILGDVVNQHRKTIRMEPECIADKGIFLEKKKYVLNKLYEEGIYFVDKPKLKIRGIEIIRTSTPKMIRDDLKKAVELIFASESVDDLREFIKKVKEEYYASDFEHVAFPRSVNGFAKYSPEDKGVPIQLRAAFIGNQAIRKAGLDQKYKMISEGDKAYFAYIKEPNIFFSNVVGFLDKVPSELQSKFEINYDLQFEKVFLAPIEKITNTIGWSVRENMSSIEDFFS